MRTPPGLEWLNRRLARVVLEPLSPEAWLRQGALRPVVVLCLVLASFPLAGVVRTITALPILPCLGLAILLIALCVLPFVPALRASRTSWLHLALGSLSVCVVASFSTYCLYNRYFGGLTNYRGTDTGFHIASYHAFVRTTPDAYHGFVSMYAALYFVQHLLSLNAFWALAVVFYGEVVLACALPLVITFSLLWPLRRQSSLAYGIGAALAAPVALIVQYLVVLPQQHQNQADGFYPHLFGLLPLLTIWLIDALVRQPLLRFAAVLLAFVCYRYTYGLNLGDLALAVAALAALDACDTRNRAWWRGLLGITSLGMAGAAYFAYKALWPVHTLSGHVVPYNVPLSNDAQVIGLGGLALVMAAGSGARGLFAGGGLRRAARFPFLFGAINLMIVLLYMRSGAPRIYYFFKYPIAGLILVASACGALTPAVLARGIAELRLSGWRRVLTPAAALVCVGLPALAVSKWADATPLYRAGFEERAWGKPPFKSELNLPLADLGAWSRIEDVLHDKHKKFGGYVVSQFGMMIFMNAALEVPDFGWSTWFAGPPAKPLPGYCVFWDEGPPTDWLVWEFGFPLKALRQQLELDRSKQCRSYRAHWNPDGPPRTLCYRCN